MGVAHAASVFDLRIVLLLLLDGRDDGRDVEDAEAGRGGSGRFGGGPGEGGRRRQGRVVVMGDSGWGLLVMW